MNGGGGGGRLINALKNLRIRPGRPGRISSEADPFIARGFCPRCAEDARRRRCRGRLRVYTPGRSFTGAHFRRALRCRRHIHDTAAVTRR